MVLIYECYYLNKSSTVVVETLNALNEQHINIHTPNRVLHQVLCDGYYNPNPIKYISSFSVWFEYDVAVAPTHCWSCYFPQIPQYTY